MTSDAYITLLILVVTIVLLIRGRIPPVAVFMGALTATMAFQLAPMNESLKGFSNSGMLTVGVLLMVAAGMYRTGAITLITEKIIGRPATLLAAQLKILPPVAIGSAFLNNTPLVAMFIPVIRDLSKACRLPAKRLYIPLSYTSILGGTCTLIGTSTNLVVAGMVIDLIAKNAPGTPPINPVGMFDLTWVGLPATLAGIVFMIVASRFLLPGDKPLQTDEETTRRFGAEFSVPTGSPLIGKSLKDVGFIEPVGFELLELRRSDGTVVDVEPATRLEAGTTIVVSAELNALADIWSMEGMEPLHGVHWQKLSKERFTHRLVEVVVSRRAPAIGQQIKDIPLPDSPLKASLVGLSRGGKPVEGPMAEIRVQAGDVGVMEVDESFFHENMRKVAFSMVRRVTKAQIKRYDRAIYASVITVAMVTVVALGWMSMLTAALLATGAMIMTGCMGLRDAGRSIDFSTLIIIASAIGLEAAVTGSGLSAKVADIMMNIGGDNPYIALTVVFLGCIAMDTIITNVASAVFMFPIAMAMAANLGVNGMPFVITVMVGASCSFISPMGYQTNLMVFGPGGYKYTDFVKMGVPLTIVVGIITMLLAPMIWPF